MHKFQKSSCFEFESGYESGYYFVSLHRNIKNGAFDTFYSNLHAA